MALYSPLSGEGLFDIAAKLYGDTVAGVQDLLTLNPSIDLDADDLFGQELTYTAGLKRVKPVFPEPEMRVSETIYTTRERQSVYDLAIQLYGDLSKIGNILNYFPNLDDNITVGSEITLSDQEDPMAVYFKDRQIIVSTDLDMMSEDSFLLLQTGDFILFRNGGKIILQNG
jgi:hypothetical protein